MILETKGDVLSLVFGGAMTFETLSPDFDRSS